jgi:hypothetical protein
VKPPPLSMFCFGFAAGCFTIVLVNWLLKL